MVNGVHGLPISVLIQKEIPGFFVQSWPTVIDCDQLPVLGKN